MAVDYRKLDSLIVDVVSNAQYGGPLDDPCCIAESERLAALHGGDDFRYIDRRLQALRKLGVIVYLKKHDAPHNKPGWYLTAGKDCCAKP